MVFSSFEISRKCYIKIIFLKMDAHSIFTVNLDICLYIYIYILFQSLNSFIYLFYPLMIHSLGWSLTNCFGLFYIWLLRCMGS
jgi:hypothetical protein